jgi:transcriptional regulator with XRE-family HTH domain
MLQTLLQKAMAEKNLSSHTAAEAIGVSHTTILRALRGDRIDVDTIIKIANWMGVRPSELLNSMSDTSLADTIAVILSHSQEMEQALKDAAERVRAGQLDPHVLEDMVSFALYRINTSGDGNANKNRAGATKRARE